MTRTLLLGAALTVLAASASAAGPAPLAADVSLVEPYSYDLQRGEPFRAPYYAHFQSGAKDLYFVASVHSNETASPTFKLIRALMAKHSPDVALIEGVPAQSGTNPPGLLADYRKTCDARSCKWGEPAYVAVAAADAGKAFSGTEPSDALVLSRIASAGYNREDLLGFYYLRQLPQMRRDGSLKKEAREAAYRDLMHSYAQRLNVSPQVLPSYDDFRRWYRGKTGTDFDAAAIKGEALAPLETGAPIQRLSAAVDRVRNQFMLEVVVRTLNAHDRVLVVLGSSHLAVQRPALEAMLGPAVEQSNKVEK